MTITFKQITLTLLPVMMVHCIDEAFEVLSKRMWRLALAEVPPDDQEFIGTWASIVLYCNTYGRPASEKQKLSFSSYCDPHGEHSSMQPPLPEEVVPHSSKVSVRVRHWVGVVLHSVHNSLLPTMYQLFCPRTLPPIQKLLSSGGAAVSSIQG